MGSIINIKEWANTWTNCYKVSLGNVRSYKRRLRELESLNIQDDENRGKRIALRSLIDYPEL